MFHLFSNYLNVKNIIISAGIYSRSQENADSGVESVMLQIASLSYNLHKQVFPFFPVVKIMLHYTIMSTFYCKSDLENALVYLINKIILTNS